MGDVLLVWNIRVVDKPDSLGVKGARYVPARQNWPIFPASPIFTVYKSVVGDGHGFPVAFNPISHNTFQNCEMMSKKGGPMSGR
jgi:hypothetical protein